MNLSTWIRVGRLGENSLSGYVGLGPFELWFGWLYLAPIGFGFSILPGSEPMGPGFDYLADFELLRLRVTLVWLGRRPEFWLR